MDGSLLTRWGRDMDREHVPEAYPRPGLKRSSYVCLNGLWDYAFTDTQDFPEQYEGKILVPFSPEAPLSGVNRILQPDQVIPQFPVFRRKVLLPFKVGQDLFTEKQLGLFFFLLLLPD